MVAVPTPEEDAAALSNREIQAQDWSSLPASEIAITVLQSWALRKGLNLPDDEESLELICEEWLQFAAKRNE